MIITFIKTICDFISHILNKKRSLLEQSDFLEKELIYFENQIDLDNFDPNLSIIIDQINTQMESKNPAHPNWHVGDP